MRYPLAHIAQPVLRSYPAEKLRQLSFHRSTQIGGGIESTSVPAAQPQPRSAPDAAAPAPSPPADAAPAHSQTPSAAAAPRHPLCCRIRAPAPRHLRQAILAASQPLAAQPAPECRTSNFPPLARDPHPPQFPAGARHPRKSAPRTDPHGAEPFAATRGSACSAAATGPRYGRSPLRSARRYRAPGEENWARTQFPRSQLVAAATLPNKDGWQRQSP